MGADAEEPCGCVPIPGRGLRMTTNERPLSCGSGGGRGLSGGGKPTSLSLIRRFLRLLNHSFFLGGGAPLSSFIVSALTCLRSGGSAPSPDPAPAAAAAVAVCAGKKFSITAVWLFVRTCAGGIAPAGRPRAALVIDGVGGGESSRTDGFASELGPRGRSRCSTDGNVCVEPDAIA